MRPLKIFLSHAHADATRVRALHNRLVADGVDSWLDKEKLIPGQDWEREIRKAVREADVVIVCLSKQFNQRGYRQKEVRIALDEAEMVPEDEIFIVPARLEECENLDSLRKWHWVDLFEKGGYEKLLDSLHFCAQKAGAGLQPKKSSIAGVFNKSKTQLYRKEKDQKIEETQHKSIWTNKKLIGYFLLTVGSVTTPFFYFPIFITLYGSYLLLTEYKPTMNVVVKIVVSIVVSIALYIFVFSLLVALQ